MSAHVDAASRRTGMIQALAAFGVWGVVPIFWHQLDHVPSGELLAHRVVGSSLLLLALVARRGELGALRALATDVRRLPWLVASALLIGLNWYLYLGAVQADRVIEASLGYFVNPLVNVLLGLVVLRERLRPGQWVAVALASAGVAVLTLRAGTVPWLAVALAGSFGVYGLVRKRAPAGALVGSVVEMGVLAVPAAAVLLLWASRGQGALGHADLGTHVLILLGGLVTAAPLLWFAEASRRLPLSTLGFVQYVSPVGQLLVGVLVYHEPFDRLRAAGFALIWAALAAFTFDARWTRLRRVDA